MAEAQVWYQPIYPSETLTKVLDVLIDSGIVALILGTYGSGTVPSMTYTRIEFGSGVPRILLPNIQKATSMGIPVFGIRQTFDGHEVLKGVLPGRYGSEAEAIVAGLIPLQRDQVDRDEVILGIQEICEQHSSYEDRVKATKERFSTPAFNERLERIAASSNPQEI